MPRQDKKKKKKTKLGKLTNAEILKLIKKLKPKTSQVVKINIGDKGEKGQMKSSSGGGSPAQSGGAIVFTHGYGAPLPPPPPVPSAPLPPQATITAAPTFNRQAVPFKPRQIQAPTRLSQVGSEEFSQRTALLQKPEPKKVGGLSETFGERVKRQLQNLPSGGVELFQKEFGEQTKKFNAPKYAPPSNLGSNVRAYQADTGVVNDPYFNDRIQTVGGSDQIGVTNAFSLSSDAWKLSPEGDTQPTEIIGAAAAPVEEQPAAATVEPDFSALITPEEQERIIEQDKQLKQFEEVFEKSMVSKQKLPPLKSSTGAPQSNASVTQEINSAILTKGFNIGGYELSNTNVYQSGKNKGLLRNNLTQTQLEEIYTDLKGTY